MAYRWNKFQSLPLRQEEEAETFTKYNKCQDMRMLFFFFKKKGAQKCCQSTEERGLNCFRGKAEASWKLVMGI